MKKPVLTVLLAVIIVAQSCVFCGAFVAFDIGPLVKSAFYNLFNDRSDLDPDADLVVIQDIFGRYGYMDNKGNVVIWPRFASASTFHEGLAAVGVGCRPIYYKEGFINKNGSFVIEPTFDLVNDFSDGLAVVTVGNKYGAINKQGELAIRPKFSYMADYENGFSSATIEELKIDEDHKYIPKYYKIDKTGTIVAEANNDIYQLSDGMVRICADNSYGYLDASNQVMIKPQYASAMDFQNGIAHVRDKETMLWGSIDKAGNVIIPFKYSRMYHFTEGLAAVQDPKSKLWGYIDEKGKTVIPCMYLGPKQEDFPDPLMLFQDGLACVAEDENNYLILDITGKPVMPPFAMFHNIPEGSEHYYIDPETHEPRKDFINNYGYSGEGLHWIEYQPGTLTFFRNNGTVAFTTEGQTAGRYSEGLCEIEKDKEILVNVGMEGFIDKTGKLIIGFKNYGSSKYEGGISDFKNGIAKVYNKLDGFIDKKGRFIWRTGTMKYHAFWFSVACFTLMLLLAYAIINIHRHQEVNVRLIRKLEKAHLKATNPAYFAYLYAVKRKKSLLCMVRYPYRKTWSIASPSDYANLNSFKQALSLVWLIKFPRGRRWRVPIPKGYEFTEQ